MKTPLNDGFVIRIILKSEIKQAWSASQQRQLSLAGVSINDKDKDLSQAIEYFPHRGFQTAEFEFTQSDEEDSLRTAEGQGSHAKTLTPRQSKTAHLGSHLDNLLRSTHQLLDEGKVEKSAKLFAIILQLRLDGRPIDIRQYDLWALGAEIIMRGGEEDRLRRLGLQSTAIDCGGSYTHIRVPLRWGSNTNINKLRAYMEELIQKYPYDRKFPRKVSAIDFQLALKACEIFNCHAQFMAEISRLTGERQTWQEDVIPHATSHQREVNTHDDSFGMMDGNDETTSPARSNVAIEHIRNQICTTITTIAAEMDTMIDNPPYSGNKYFLHLRAIASLMIADLLVFTSKGEDSDAHEATKAVEAQLEAKDLLQKIMDRTERSVSSLLDISVQQICVNQQSQQQRLHVSLPIRGI
ncbi:hypothetical protein C2857_001006 [Epichloe festucae Fl1]|uniref:Uncharacterized protein n=1 Tax=Epichloe festucae (strain Fl1) TaxID=877507 RepID=A0A7U3Q108_EPIFF|nr:hypothetical protein C2857_001006 [Epichloe festucae Fl1]